MKNKRLNRGVKKRVKEDFFKENYKKSWNYIKESKNFIFVIIGIFFVSVLLGFLYQPVEITSKLLDYIKEILEKTEGMSSIEMISFIFFNNIKVGFMGLIYGFVVGIFPILATFVNGYVVGYASSLSISSSGLVSLLNLFPHGIFELPAIFISFGMGLKFGTFIFYKDKIKIFGLFFKESLRVLIFVIFPLLVIAAIIEGILIFF